MFKLSGKSVGVIAVLIVMGFLQGLVLNYYLFPGKPDIPPRDAINQALSNTARTQSYEYNILMSTLIDGKEELTSNVRGEKESPNRIHIKGHVTEAEVDFYLYDKTTYTKDQLTGEWIKFTDNQINQQEIFMGELNPLASFAYKELNDAKYIGREKMDDQKYLVYTANPVIDNKYMELTWQNFQYKVWVEPRGLRIYKAQVTAVNKTDPADKMTLLVEFRNYNGNFKIKPPI